jgi:mannose-6-phosphate isomerase-like protein (cupin superfamily)
MKNVSGFCVLGASMALIACAKDTAQPEPAVQAGSATTAPQSPLLHTPHRALLNHGLHPSPTLIQPGGAVPPESASAPPAAAPPPPFVGPPTADFIDVVAPKGSPVILHGCDEVAVAVATGKLTALGETLVTGDVLLVHGAGSFEMKGVALVAVGRVVPRTCTPSTTLDKKIVRGTAASPLVWAHGAMTAHLDLDEQTSPDLYVGRLEGTAPVAEHTHAGVYELLCTVQADGVLVLDGHPQLVGPKTCLVIPPDTKHAWNPTNGAKLVAIQMYAPPGPEQRFKKLAAQEAAGDGG